MLIIPKIAGIFSIMPSFSFILRSSISSKFIFFIFPSKSIDIYLFSLTVTTPPPSLFFNSIKYLCSNMISFVLLIIEKECSILNKFY